MATVYRGGTILSIRRSGHRRGRIMKTAVIKRSININGCKTSISLENEFWEALREMAGRENIALSTLVEQINQHRNNINLSSAIRVFVFNHFRAAAKNEAKPEVISADYQPSDS
jgi:predicted DNA-binding ribbon-helix-helix protein